MHPLPQLCERARSWASLRADDEISELESALLDAHLERCADCRGFARATLEVAAALRAARLERPAPLVLAAARGRGRGLRAAQAVAAAAVVVATGALAAVSGTAERTAAAKPVSMVASAESPDGLRELRRPGLVDSARTIPRNRQVPGEAV